MSPSHRDCNLQPKVGVLAPILGNRAKGTTAARLWRVSVDGRGWCNRVAIGECSVASVMACNGLAARK